MNKAISSLLAISLFLASLQCQAQEYGKLDGTYAIKSATLIDPPSNEKKDRIVMIIKGNAAKDMYDEIPAKAKKSKCDAEMLLKIAGNLACTKESNFYTCNVAILLRTGETASALVC
ncbi:hypothetical protein MJ904_19340 [Massilia sp. MB5]|uniref:hypothetical protein n=1 Tax=Massilia sp. MB5 TaxID=2919578 RepID=UPI001F10E5B6|nr:hypothetical protein [Massilia sp. MB5]UMR29226.1 hypothetical protein MJ904_19340 [Massilia sp. MB5]